MPNTYFPWIASSTGVLLTLVLFFAGATSDPNEYALPLLMLLFICELGVLVTAAGAYIGARMWLTRRENIALLLVAVASAVLAIGLAAVGLILWQANRLG